MRKPKMIKPECLLMAVVLKVGPAGEKTPRAAMEQFLAGEAPLVAALRQGIGRGARLLLFTEGNRKAASDADLWELLREVFPGVVGGPHPATSAVASSPGPVEG